MLSNCMESHSQPHTHTKTMQTHFLESRAPYCFPDFQRNGIALPATHAHKNNADLLPQKLSPVLLHNCMESHSQPHTHTKTMQTHSPRSLAPYCFPIAWNRNPSHTRTQKQCRLTPPEAKPRTAFLISNCLESLFQPRAHKNNANSPPQKFSPVLLS
jgi:hypothetical protein